MSQVVWYCHIGDQMLGPLTSYQLMEMARSGRLREADTVKNADTDWIEARQVAGLEFDSRELVPPPPSTDARPNDNGTDHLGLSASSLAMAGVLIAILGGMGILGLVVALLITSQNGSNPSPSASTDYVALQTKAAWDQMQASDIYLTSRLGNGVGTYEAVFLERAEFWAERVTQYSMIDTDYVDEELTEHIRRWITLSHQTRTCNEMFVQEVKQLEAAVASFTQLGANLGSTNSQDRRGGAIWGAAVFGNLGQMIGSAEYDQIAAKYQAQYDLLAQDGDRLIQEREQLASKLSEKYSTPFRQRL